MTPAGSNTPNRACMSHSNQPGPMNRHGLGGVNGLSRVWCRPRIGFMLPFVFAAEGPDEAAADALDDVPAPRRRCFVS